MDQDLLVVGRWWSTIAPTIPASIVALWFGITDLVVDGRGRRTMYVAGCDRFDPRDGDWAAPPYAWWPDNRYVFPPGLAALPDRDYPVVLDYAARLVRSVTPHVGLNLEGVAVGFDDGDIEIVWSRG